MFSLLKFYSNVYFFFLLRKNSLGLLDVITKQKGEGSFLELHTGTYSGSLLLSDHYFICGVHKKRPLLWTLLFQKKISFLSEIS